MTMWELKRFQSRLSYEGLDPYMSVARYLDICFALNYHKTIIELGGDGFLSDIAKDCTYDGVLEIPKIYKLEML